MRKLLLTTSLLLALNLAAAAREVTDDTGRKVDIPDNPQRIVALHEPVLAVPLLELGLDVVGIYGRDDDGNSLMSVDFLHDMLGRPKDAPPITGIGAVGNIDLEKLRALQPDLIIGTDYDAANVEKMSPIAPVYLQNASAATAHGVSVQAELADLLNSREAFEALNGEYQDRVARLRAAHPDSFPANPGDKTYLIVMVTDQINLVGGMSGAVQALEDLGFQRAPLAEGDQRQSPSMLMVPIGAESFGQLNPDLLVVMNSFANADRSAGAISAELDTIVPGWSRFMKPAQEGRVVFLDSAQVTSSALASANHTLDAMESWAAQ